MHQDGRQHRAQHLGQRPFGGVDQDTQARQGQGPAPVPYALYGLGERAGLKVQDHRHQQGRNRHTQFQTQVEFHGGSSGPIQ